MFKQMKLGVRVALALGAMVAILAGMGIYSGRVLKALDDSDTVLYEQNLIPIQGTAELRRDLNVGYRNILSAAITKDPAERADFLKKLTGNLQSADKNIQDLIGAIKADEVKKVLAPITPATQEYRKEVESAMEALRRGEIEAVLKSGTSGALVKALNACGGSIEALQTLLTTRAKARSDQNTVEAAAEMVVLTCRAGGVAVWGGGGGRAVSRLLNTDGDKNKQTAIN